MRWRWAKQLGREVSARAMASAAPELFEGWEDWLRKGPDPRTLWSTSPAPVLAVHLAYTLRVPPHLLVDAACSCARLAVTCVPDVDPAVRSALTAVEQRHQNLTYPTGYLDPVVTTDGPKVEATPHGRAARAVAFCALAASVEGHGSASAGLIAIEATASAALALGPSATRELVERIRAIIRPPGSQT